MGKNEKELEQIKKLVNKMEIDHGTKMLAAHQVQMYLAYRKLGLPSKEAADLTASYFVALMDNSK